jgi:hypothetical protein
MVETLTAGTGAFGWGVCFKAFSVAQPVTKSKKTTKKVILRI